MLFSSLGIVVTYQCNARCATCGPRCGPHRKERLTIEEIKQLIDEATDCGSKLICFTGGEPTLLGPSLEEVIAHATARGNLTRVVSNGWWAKNPAAARKRLNSLMEAGLTELNISADDWHLVYVPLERIRFAVEAAQELGIRTIIAVGETRKSQITAQFLQEYLPGNPPLHQEGTGDPCTMTVAIRKGAILPFGNASENIPEEDIITARVNKAAVEGYKKRGCGLILSFPAVLPDGRVAACCSLFNEESDALILGYWPQQSLREIFGSGENDVLHNWIKLEGPYGIKEFIEREAPDIKFKEAYAGICHLCEELLHREDTRRVLKERLHQMRDHVVMLKLQRLSRLNLPLGCIESRRPSKPSTEAPSGTSA